MRCNPVFSDPPAFNYHSGRCDAVRSCISRTPSALAYRHDITQRLNLPRRGDHSKRSFIALFVSAVCDVSVCVSVALSDNCVFVYTSAFVINVNVTILHPAVPLSIIDAC